MNSKLDELKRKEKKLRDELRTIERAQKLAMRFGSDGSKYETAWRNIFEELESIYRDSCNP